MELEVQHENQTIILWLRSGCRADLSLLMKTGRLMLSLTAPLYFLYQLKEHLYFKMR